MIEEHAIENKILLPTQGKVELSYGEQDYMALSFKERVKVKIIAESAAREMKAEGTDEFGQESAYDAFLIMAAARYGAAMTDGVDKDFVRNTCEPESLDSLFDYGLSEEDIQILGLAVIEDSGMTSLLKLAEPEEDDEDDDDDNGQNQNQSHLIG